MLWIAVATILLALIGIVLAVRAERRRSRTSPTGTARRATARC